MNSYSTMSLNSLNLFFLFIFTTFLLLSSTSKAQNQNPTFLYQFCSTNKTTANSTYKSNLRTLFSSLSSNAAKEFYNTTVPSRTPSNTVYGLYMCRGDVSSSPCQQCVTNATQKLSTDSDCSLSKRAVIWYDECMVRYSNTSFFSTMATNPGVILMNTGNISNQESFMPLMFDTMNKTADKAANSSVGAKKYATTEATISGFQTLYTLAQCTDDLSQQDCRTCLSDAIGYLPQGKQGGRLLFPSCNVRYEVYPFYRNPAPSPTSPPSATPGLVPPTTTSNLGEMNKLVQTFHQKKMHPFKSSAIHSVTFSFFNFLIFSSQSAPIYNSHVCTNSSKDQPNTTFQTNLNILFSSLSSNATNGNHFYQTTVASETPNAVKGLFLCRGDTLTTTCRDCVTAASTDLKRRCSVNKEAIIWYDVCTVRYSNNYLNNIVPSVDLSDSKTVTSKERNRFNALLARLLNVLATKAANSDKEKFATGKVNFTRSVKIYGLVQCVPELSLFDCNMCLRSAIASVPNCCDGKQGARVLLPACNIRYELYLFYNSTELITGPVQSRRSGRCRFEVVLGFVVPIVAVMVFLGFGMCSVMRKQGKSFMWRKTVI